MADERKGSAPGSANHHEAAMVSGDAFIASLARVNRMRALAIFPVRNEATAAATACLQTGAWPPVVVFSGVGADLLSAEMNENVGTVRNRDSSGREGLSARRARKLDREGPAEATPVSGNSCTRIDSGCEQHRRKRFRGEIRRLDRIPTGIPAQKAHQRDENACGLFDDANRGCVASLPFCRNLGRRRAHFPN